VPRVVTLEFISYISEFDYSFTIWLVAPKVLILGHLFVKRLSWDMVSSFDSRMDMTFGLEGSVSVWLSGVGDRTVGFTGLTWVLLDHMLLTL
jgi:hypothetical protein